MVSCKAPVRLSVRLGGVILTNLIQPPLLREDGDMSIEPRATYTPPIPTLASRHPKAQFTVLLSLHTRHDC